MSQLLKITTLFYGLASCIPALSQATAPKKRLYISLMPLLSTENFRWSIAGNEQGTNPNILSELHFIRLRQAGFSMGSCYRIGRRFSLEATAAVQYGYSGRVTDIDYAGNDRRLPVAILKLRSRKNNTRDYRVQGGYELFRGRSFSITAGAGYFLSKANYRMHDRSGKDAKGIYNAQWRGPFLNLQAEIPLPKNWEIRAAITTQYHTYQAEADWRFRSNFSHPLSFIHRANGWGMNGHLGLHYQFSSKIGLQLKGSLQQWKTGAGSDLLYLADGGMVSTRMNESVKTQLGMGLGGVFGF